MIEAYSLLLVVVSYFLTDRLLSQYYTGSWWQQPSDVETEEVEDR
jgi:hypothetical protein